MNNFKLHLHKYFFYDLLAIFLFFLITFIGIKLYNAYQINKKTEYDFSSYDSFMNEVKKND